MTNDLNLVRKDINVVPSRRTRQLAEAMVLTARTTSGPDAVVRLLPQVPPEQLPALVGLILNQGKIQRRTGRKPIPLRYSEEQRRTGYTAYRKGVRNPEVVAQFREYNRVVQMRWRERVGR